MPMTCDLCSAPADWKRPASSLKGMTHEGYRCDRHTPPWRIDTYEPLTLVAKSRLELAHAPLADDEPKPKKARKKATK